MKRVFNFFLYFLKLNHSKNKSYPSRPEERFKTIKGGKVHPQKENLNTNLVNPKRK